MLGPKDFWELPHLALDGQGRPWLLVRHEIMRQPDTPLEGPIDLALWEIRATRFDGEHWSELRHLPHSNGRNEMMPTTATDAAGDLWAAWPTDLRNSRSYLPNHLEVFVARLGQGQNTKPMELAGYSEDPAPFHPFTPHEREDVRRIRQYRGESGGKSYHIFRGDLHRHTDVSIDGNNDGSLLDAYRYAMDAASLDFLGVADHTEDAIDLYAWWRSQKVADLFQLRDSFAAFYGYERSVEYPNGHRNVFFAERGSNITPIIAMEWSGGEGLERLYWYLRQRNGFSIPHTTGRTSGTDWRYNDPKVENLVELYQGMRDTYEYPGAPRPKRIYAQFPDPSKPVPRASSIEQSPSFRPLGFVWKALEKGYRLGFIASSDHISTHISHACLLARDLTTKSLLEAVRAHRAYAATADIILDVRYTGSTGEHLMGETFSSTTPVDIRAKIIGTGPLLQVDLIRNGKIIDTVKPEGDPYAYRFTEREQPAGESYYYVRVIQQDGDMAWGSPAWVRKPR